MRRLPGLVALAFLAEAPVAADPDFTQPAAAPHVDRSVAASSADSDILPSDDVGFGVDSSVLSADTEATLDLVSHWLAVHPHAHLVVIAHTDSSGTPAHNDDLSVKRSRMIRDYLMSAGISTSRVVLVACGARGHASRRADLMASTNPSDPFPSCDQ